jgi:hypothetical protein
MKRVVLIGRDPATVDFSDPALPPGMTAEKIHAGVKLALADFAARGWHAQNCFINPMSVWACWPPYVRVGDDPPGAATFR